MRPRGAVPSSCDLGFDSRSERTANAFVARASMPEIVPARNAYLFTLDGLTGALSCVSSSGPGQSTGHEDKAKGTRLHIQGGVRNHKKSQAGCRHRCARAPLLLIESRWRPMPEKCFKIEPRKNRKPEQAQENRREHKKTEIICQFPINN